MRDPEYDHVRSQSSLDLMRNIPGKESFFIKNIWIIPDAILNETDTLGEYDVKISNRLFGFYLPYLLQKPIDIQENANPRFTLAIADLGHAHNWVVCRAINEFQWVGMDIDLSGVAEFKVLKKVGVMRTDSCSELLVGGEHGVSLLQKMDCYLCKIIFCFPTWYACIHHCSCGEVTVSLSKG